jgi:hypothetical protein
MMTSPSQFIRQRVAGDEMTPTATNLIATVFASADTVATNDLPPADGCAARHH